MLHLQELHVYEVNKKSISDSNVVLEGKIRREKPTATCLLDLSSLFFLYLYTFQRETNETNSSSFDDRRSLGFDFTAFSQMIT